MASASARCVGMASLGDEPVRSAWTLATAMAALAMCSLLGADALDSAREALARAVATSPGG